MKQLTQKLAPTFEGVLASLKETDRILSEKFAETDRKFQENERLLRKSSEEFDRRMKKFEETMGSWSNNHGSFAEEYFFNSFEKGQKTFSAKNLMRFKKA